MTNKLTIRVFSILFPLSAVLFFSCSNKPSQEQTAKAEEKIENAHKMRDYQLLMRLADILEAENIKEMDAVVSLTDSDERNMVTSMYA